MPVSGTAFDEDGMPINFLLHVQDGFLYELEILRVDGLDLKTMPTGEQIDVEIQT